VAATTAAVNARPSADAAMFEVDTRDPCPDPLFLDPQFALEPTSLPQPSPLAAPATSKADVPLFALAAAPVVAAPPPPPSAAADYNTWTDGWFTPAPMPVEATRDDELSTATAGANAGFSVVINAKSGKRTKSKDALKKAA